MYKDSNVSSLQYNQHSFDIWHYTTQKMEAYPESISAIVYIFHG